ncbi:MAG: hypothetical protein HYR85_12010 [Planctomycetes bacterium]|nr:hypothetical protein [Planctomycetota bacterium]MBI3844409.1 hypothetical protein [Planctomycetota bacterium]
MSTRSRYLSLTWLVNLVLATTVVAHPNGELNRSGRTGSTCRSCHGGTAAVPTASFALAPVNPLLPPTSVGIVPGARYTVSISVTGGPSLRWGFDADASAGAAVLTSPTLTRVSTTRPQEVTHVTAGTHQSSWSYDWIAPATADPVTFWLAVNSANNNNSDTGDGIGTTSVIFNSLPAEILARLGAVNTASGIDNVVDVLTIRGGAGDSMRHLGVQTGQPFSLEINAYPGAPASVPYAVYALNRENTAADLTPHPLGLGTGCFATPISGGRSTVVTNVLGSDAQFGSAMFPGTPAGPGAILAVPRVPARYRGRTFTLMAVVQDSQSPSGNYVFTNAIVMQVL